MYKIIVIDDEVLIRKSIVKKINKYPADFEIVKEASNAIEGIRIINEIKPDIIICDIRMDDISGLDMISMIKPGNPEAEIIIISGYDDFEYARQAIELGICEYLLKPIDTNTFNKGMLKCISKLEQNKITRLSSIYSEILEKSTYDKKILDKILQQGKDFYQHLFKEYNDNCSFISIYLYAITGDDIRVLMLSNNILKSIRGLELSNNYVQIQHNANEFSFIFMCEQFKADYFAEYLEKLKLSIKTNNIKTFTIGLSDKCQLLEDAFYRSLKAMKNRILYPDKTIINYTDCKNNKKKYLLSAMQKNSLEYALSHRQVEILNSFYDTLFNDLTTENVSYHYIKIVYTDILNLLEKYYYNQKEIEKTFKSLHEIESIPEMIEYLKLFSYNIALSMDDSGNNYKASIIEKLKLYINENYGNSISLKEFCKQNSINVSFLSNEFKKNVGLSYNDWLLKVRIENATKLLASNNYKVKEVSELCGFSNQHYFSKVFKSSTGLSPSEFLNKE